MAESISDKQIVLLRAKLRRFGYFKYPRLRIEIEDLVAQTLADLWKFMASRPVDHSLDADSVRRVAFAIFDRRAVDLHRKCALEWANNQDAGLNEMQEDPAPEGAASAELYRRMLRICVAELADCAEEDHLVLALVTGLAAERTDAMTAAERQRLRRLRTRLTAAISRELGDSATDLLR